MHDGLRQLPGLGFYASALLLSPLLLEVLDRSERFSRAGRLIFSVLIPVLLVAASSPVPLKVLRTAPGLGGYREVFGPALAGAALYGAALSNRRWPSRLAILAFAAAVLAAYLRVSENHRIVLESLSRHEEMELEMAALKTRVLVSGALLAATVLISALLRARKGASRAAPELLAALAAVAIPFLPRPVSSSLRPSEIAGLSSPRLLDGDLYFSASLRTPRERFADDRVLYLLRLRKGEEIPVVIWPRGARWPTLRVSSEPAEAARFIVREQRWWYLLAGQYLAEKILDAGTGRLETVFRYPLHPDREDRERASSSDGENAGDLAPKGRAKGCREIGGQCLAVISAGTTPTPHSFPTLVQTDPQTGSSRAIAAVAGPIQRLSDSVVFAAVELQQSGRGIAIQRSILRYWPRDGRRQALFSTPPEKP